MADHELRAIVEKVYALAGEGEWDAAEAYLSDDLEIHEAQSLPYAGVYRGRRALRELFGIVMAHWIDPKVELHALTAGDGHVVGLATFHMTSRRSGRRFSEQLAEMWRLENGKIVEMRPYYFDTAAIVAAETL